MTLRDGKHEAIRHPSHNILLLFIRNPFHCTADSCSPSLIYRQSTENLVAMPKSQSATAKAESPIKWDDHFDDPKADVILVSKEGVQFRLSSHYAKKKW
jgi:hypothetical protein